jgi:uncharacterized protein
MKFHLENNIMKRRILVSLVALFLIIGLQAMAQGDFPVPMDPPRLVNDYVSVLSEQEFQNLEYKLEKYQDTTSNEIAIVIIRSTGPYDIGQYAAELGEKWGVGKGGKDNGILILAAIEDRNVNISTGYGLEGAVTDAASRRIIQNYIIPNFRTEDYYAGLDEATSIIIGLAAGEFSADQISGRSSGTKTTSIFSYLIPLIFFGFISFMRYRRMARNHYGHSAGFWSILALMMSSGGGRGRSNWDNFSGGSGSFGGGGGGFGGFGGGSFGGGGAGGSW